MKTLVVYFSFSGNNKLLAQELKSILDCEIMQIHEPRKRTGFSIFLDVLFRRTPKIMTRHGRISQYDHVILVAPVWAGRIANPLKSFLKLAKPHLNDYSFITLCGAGGNKGLRDELRKLAGKEPVSFMELAVRDLLPTEKKDNVRYTSGYKIQLRDIEPYRRSIKLFLGKALPNQSDTLLPNIPL